MAGIIRRGRSRSRSTDRRDGSGSRGNRSHEKKDQSNTKGDSSNRGTSNDRYPRGPRATSPYPNKEWIHSIEESEWYSDAETESDYE